MWHAAHFVYMYCTFCKDTLHVLFILITYMYIAVGRDEIIKTEIVTQINNVKLMSEVCLMHLPYM